MAGWMYSKYIIFRVCRMRIVYTFMGRFAQNLIGDSNLLKCMRCIRIVGKFTNDDFRESEKLLGRKHTLDDMLDSVQDMPFAELSCQGWNIWAPRVFHRDSWWRELFSASLVDRSLTRYRNAAETGPKM